MPLVPVFFPFTYHLSALEMSHNKVLYKCTDTLLYYQCFKLCLRTILLYSSMLMTISYLLDSPLPLYLLPLYIHCIADLNSCFCSNGLCLNAVKLEATLFGAHQHLHSFPAVPSVNIASSTVTVSDKITPHGVIINKYFTLILIFLQFARNPFFIFEL